MRIAFYAPLKPPTHPKPSGDRLVARNLMKALRLGGHTVELASVFRSYDGKGDTARQERLKANGVRLAERLVLRYRRSPAGQRPQVWFTYHVYHKAPDWLGPAVTRDLSIPYVVAEASHAPKQHHGPWDLGYRGAEAAIRQADAIFALNANDIPCLRPLMAAGAKLVALKPFIDTAPFKAAFDARRENRREIGKIYRLDDETPRLLTVAMMRPGDKLASYQLLGKALSRLADRRWWLLVVGDGEARQQVDAALAPIAARVVRLGAIDAVSLPALCAGADLYLWPAVNEAYGMAFLEAQAGGLPAIAGRTGGVPGVVRDGETGLLVREGATDDFAAAVAKLLDDQRLRQRLGSAAAAAAVRDHDIHGAAKVMDAELRRAVR